MIGIGDLKGCKKEGKELLKAEKFQYNSLVENMQEGFFIADIITNDAGEPVDYRFIEANQALENQTGIPLGRLIGKTALEMHPGLDQFWIQTFGSVALTGKPVRFDHYSTVQKRYYEVSSHQIRYGQFAAFFLDINERKLTENALRASEEKYRSLYENSLDGILLAKPDGTILSANSQACSLFGMTGDEIIQAGRDSIIVKNEKLSAMLKERELTGRAKAELAFRRKDGSTFVGETSSSFFTDADGILNTSMMIRDVTERKQAEKDFKKSLETLHYSEDQFRALVQNVKSGIALIDETGRFAVVNPTFMQMFGLSDGLDILNVNSQDWSQWEVYGEDLKLLHVDDHPIRKAVITGKPVRSQLVAVRNPGANELTWMLINAEPIQKENGQIHRVICTYQDITELRRVEEALRKAHDTLEEKVKERTKELEKAYDSLKESEESLAEAQRMAHLGNWYRSLITDKIYWSDEAYRIFGLEPQEFEVSFSVFLNCIHPEDRDYVKDSIEKALNGDPYDIDFRIISANRKEHTVHSQGEVVFNKNGDTIGMRGTVQDITDRKKMEEQIHHRAEELEMIMDVAPVAIFVAHDPQGNDITGNTKASEYSEAKLWENVSANTVPGRRFFHKGRELTADELPVQQAALKNMDIRNAEIDIILPSGRHEVILGSASPLHDAKGNVRGSVGAFIDITERIKAEETLAKIEQARIKEIHHRIKNNLQVISSLLSLEAERFSDTKVLTAFQESQNRVASMALIHEELYKSKEANNLNFTAYLQKLTTQLLNSYNLKNDGIRLNLKAEQVYLDMDTAIPLGIIINELVSNSLKHAFPDKKEGEISLILQKIEDSERDFKRDLENFDIEDKSKGIKAADNFYYTLIVSDNGIGIPKDFDFRNPDTLGLQLVNILVEQLDANIELEKDKGAEFIIKFIASGNSTGQAY